MEIYTIGFTKKTAEPFSGKLKQADISRLLDIRLNNWPQLAGFAKRHDLAYVLREICGPEYQHVRLAPTERRLKGDQNKEVEWEPCVERFRALLEERLVEEKIDRAGFTGDIAKRIKRGGPVILSMGLTQRFRKDKNSQPQHPLQVNNIHLEDDPLWTMPDKPANAENAEKPGQLSHYDSAGQARMVDVSEKTATRRAAEAIAFVALSPQVLAALPDNPKGNPLEVARVAGIQAAKRTSELIPMCHPVPLTHVDVEVTVCENGVAIRATAATVAVTGVEMEAMTAASVAALTVYDMCKALDRGIEIREVMLERKTGGKSGTYERIKSGSW